MVFPTIYSGRQICLSATENRKNCRLRNKFLFPFICWTVNVLQAYFSYVLVIHMYEIYCNLIKFSRASSIESKIQATWIIYIQEKRIIWTPSAGNSPQLPVSGSPGMRLVSFS